MSHLKGYIPAKHSYGWSGGPEFKTRIVTLKNGRERRNGDWFQPRHRYMLEFQQLSKSAYAAVKSQHLVCQGMLRAFLFFDGLDNEADDELFAVAAAGQTEFQLSKLSVLDGVEYRREVYALYRPDANDPGTAVDSSITVTADGSPISVTLDRDRGIVTTAPMAGGESMRWTGPFSVWTRFNRDWMPFSFDQPDGIYGSIDLIEVAPPQA